MAIPKAPSGAFVKFEKVGDGIKAKLLDLNSNGTTVKGDACPEMVFEGDDGDEVKLTCSQIRLWTLVSEMEAELTANIGGVTEVRMTVIEKRDGGKTLKHFEITSEAPVAGADMDSIV